MVNIGDCYDNQFPNLKHLKASDIKKNVSVTNLVLDNQELIKDLKAHSNTKSVFLLYDKQTEDLAKRHDLEVFNPPFTLFQRLDNKIEIMDIVTKLQLPFIPHLISEIKSYSHLQDISTNLGKKLVIQAQFGSSGTSTFFIDSRKSFQDNMALLNESTQSV